MERLVEGNCVMKHPVHSPHIGHVPIVERLVEGACAAKHPGHIRHTEHTKPCRGTELDDDDASWESS